MSFTHSPQAVHTPKLTLTLPPSGATCNAKGLASAAERETCSFCVLMSWSAAQLDYHKEVTEQFTALPAFKDSKARPDRNYARLKAPKQIPLLWEGNKPYKDAVIRKKGSAMNFAMLQMEQTLRWNSHPEVFKRSGCAVRQDSAIALSFQSRSTRCMLASVLKFQPDALSFP